MRARTSRDRETNETADFIESALATIRVFHRHPDGVVTFHSTAAGNFESVAGFKTPHLTRLLRQIEDRLRVDAHFSLNAFYYQISGPHYLPASLIRNSRRLRYLCTCFRDLECYKFGISAEQVLKALRKLEADGVIPKLSGWSESGRGIWVFWLIEDQKQPGLAQRAFPEKIALYERIQNELHARLSHLGAEAKDCPRAARLRGSINTKSGRIVVYSFERRPDGSLITYTLAGLAEQLHLETKPKKSSRPAAKRGSVPNRRRGYDALAARRLREFEKLRRMRGRFERTTRGNAAMIYAWLLRCNRYSPANAKRKIFEFGRSGCTPSLPPSRCRGELKTGFKAKMRKFTDAKIADLLDITPEESASLEKLPNAAHYGARLGPSQHPKRMRSEQRRQLINQHIAQLGYVPSTRTIAKWLCEHGCRVSYVTVAGDYHALGVHASEPRGSTIR